MTWQNELHDILRSKTLIKRVLQGAGIAFILIFIFIFISRKGKMDFEPWELLAVASVTVGGAFGGIFYDLMDILRIHGGWKKVLANVAAVLVYIVTLYLSLVLSLNATGQWD
jgi:hypothetical protein